MQDVAAALGLSGGRVRELRRLYEAEGLVFAKRKAHGRNQYTGAVTYLSDEPLPPTPKEKIRKFYDRKIEDVLQSARQSDLDGPVFGPYQPIVAIPDIHAPFTDQHCVSMGMSVIRRQYAKHGERLIIIILGDLYDFYSFVSSRMPKSQLLFTPDSEVMMARAIAEGIITEIREAAPGCTIYLMRGNHDLRGHKRVIDAGSGLEALEDYDGLWMFDGVETILDTRERLVIDDVSWHHGNLSGLHYRQEGGSNGHGHTHKGGLDVRKLPDGRWVWELDCGYWGWPEATCFNYMPRKPRNWTRGIGLVERDFPIWMPWE